MAWIELHDNLPDHPKIIEASMLLKMDKDTLVGKLIRLWTWAVNNREDGTFSEGDCNTIAETMRFKGKARRLVDALVQARLLDEMPGGELVIHDWDEHVGMLRAKRETQRAQAKERAKRFREAKKIGVTNDDSNAIVTRYGSVTVTQNNADTVPKPYLIDEEDEERRKQEVRARMREAFVRCFGREPNGAELDGLEFHARWSGEGLTETAIEYAAQHAAAAPLPYIRCTLASWQDSGITNEDELAAYEARRDLGLEVSV